LPTVVLDHLLISLTISSLIVEFAVTALCCIERRPRP